MGEAHTPSHRIGPALVRQKIRHSHELAAHGSQELVLLCRRVAHGGAHGVAFLAQLIGHICTYLPLAPVTSTVPEPGVTVRGAAMAAASVKAVENEVATAMAQRIGLLLRRLSSAAMADAGAQQLASSKTLGSTAGSVKLAGPRVKHLWRTGLQNR